MSVIDKNFFSVQLICIWFSFTSVIGKFAATSMKNNGMFALLTLLIFFAYFLSLAIYAVVWQFMIAKVPLSTAYLNKSLVIFWSLIWSALIFGEKITFNNIIGSVIIFIGCIVLNYKGGKQIDC